MMPRFSQGEVTTKVRSLESILIGLYLRPMISSLSCFDI